MTFAIGKLELKLPDSNSSLSATIDTDLPEVQENDRASTAQKQKLKHNSPNREYNLIIFGLSESSEGTSRLVRNRHDLVQAGNLLSSIDLLVTAQLICDSFRLGKYNQDKTRPLLVSLTRSGDTQSILMQRKKLSSRLGITIKPDMSLEDHKVESLLLKHLRFLINEGVEISAVKIRGNSIFVNRKKIGTVVDSTFQECQPVTQQK